MVKVDRNFEFRFDLAFPIDVMFPLLPRWFTAALRMRARSDNSVHLPDGTQRAWPSPPNTPSKDTPSHDHALLESLNKSVYEHRFINMKPTGKCVDSRRSTLLEFF